MNQQMIYIKFPTYIMLNYDVSEIVAINALDISGIRPTLKYFALDIFEFKDGKTIYYKNRDGENYQYSGEDAVALILQTVLL